MTIQWSVLATIVGALALLLYALSSYRKRRLRNARMYGLLGVALMSSAIHRATHLAPFSWLSWIALGIAVILLVAYGGTAIGSETRKPE